jgi:hypothetical protein
MQRKTVEAGKSYCLYSLFKEQLMKQHQAGITGLRAILQLRKLEAAVSGDKLSSQKQGEKQIHKLSPALTSLQGSIGI